MNGYGAPTCEFNSRDVFLDPVTTETTGDRGPRHELKESPYKIPPPNNSVLGVFHCTIHVGLVIVDEGRCYSIRGQRSVEPVVITMGCYKTKNVLTIE